MNLSKLTRTRMSKLGNVTSLRLGQLCTMDLIQVGVSVTGSEKKQFLCVSHRAGPAWAWQLPRPADVPYICT